MYYVGKNGQQTGPFTLDQLKAKFASGEILPTDLVWLEGTADWKPASTFPELSAPAPAPAASTPLGGGMGSSPISSSQAVDPSPTVLPPYTPMPGTVNTGYPIQVGPRQNPMAITGLVLGIVSLVLVCCCGGIPFNIAGIVFSVIGMNQIKKDPVNQLGKSLALTGLILSIVSLVIGIVLVILNGVSGTINWGEFQRELNKAR
jgi:hypothetical protein